MLVFAEACSLIVRNETVYGFNGLNNLSQSPTSKWKRRNDICWQHGASKKEKIQTPKEKSWAINIKFKYIHVLPKTYSIVAFL